MKFSATMLSYLWNPDIINDLATFKTAKIDKTLENYDHEVMQAVNQNWPGTSNLTNIKRGDRMVYTAQFNGSDVIVKSTQWSNELQDDWELYMNYVNFLAEDVSVASYIEPGVVSDSGKKRDKKLISMSTFAQGVCPECVDGYMLNWITNEAVVRSIGSALANMRLQSQEYTRKHYHKYNQFPSWDTMHDGM